jgi:hypothetical protein
VVSASDSQAMINLGSNQGVVLGTKFDVIEEKAPVKYKGRMLKSLPEIIAQLEITKVEPDLSHARIVEQKRAVKTDDKIKEKIDDLVAMGVNGGTK